MKQKRVMNNKGELTPLVKNAIIIASLFFAIFIVIVIVYNVVSLGAEEKESESLVDLNIIKSSVSVSDDILKLSVNGEVGEEELAKVKFIISDGINEKEISLDASDFSGEKSFEINLKNLGIDSSKKLSISVRPIIKARFKNKELKITDRISVSPTGDVKEEAIPEIEVISDIDKCSECGGAFGSDKCSRLKCHSILENNVKCFYEAGWGKTCTICSSLNCIKYSTQDDCETDRCDLSCEWSGGKCINAAVCGDDDCTGAETYLTCLKDCPAPECETNGATQECGTDVGACVKGTQICTNNVWGQCDDTYVAPSDEICDGLDNDCDDSTADDGADETWLNDATSCGVGECGSTGNWVCTGGVKTDTCSAGSPGVEICGNGIDEDCDGSDEDCAPELKANGESCSADNQCVSDICGTDWDSDDYFSESKGHSGTCQETSHPYTDCCDSDVNSNPSYSGGEKSYTNNCGLWDWDCSGTVDKYGCSTCSSCSLSGTCTNELFDCSSENRYSTATATCNDNVFDCGTTNVRNFCWFEALYCRALGTGVCLTGTSLAYSGSATGRCLDDDDYYCGYTGEWELRQRTSTCECW